MLDGMLDFVAPHLCSGCGIVGSLLCDNCKSYIIDQPYLGCVVCTKPNNNGVCQKHHLPYAKAWVVGERRHTLQRLIGGFKFQNAKAGARILATLLDERLPQLPANTIVVPIPTMASHIRERGYDHARLIAKQFAKQRKLTLARAIKHRGKTSQKQANKQQRAQQAQHAFQVTKPINTLAPYLLIDDIITTGATLEHASRLLIDNGARSVWVAAVARQPLD